MDKDIFILSACRTPIGKFQGSLSTYSAIKLGGKAIDGALQKAKVSPEQVDMVTMGCVVTASLGEAPAKQAGIFGRIPESTYSRTVESVCGSALEAIVSTIDVLLLDRVQLGVAGGMESRTNAPYLLAPTFFKNSEHFSRGERLHLKKAGAYRWQYKEYIEEQAKISNIIDATTYDGLFWPVERKFMREYALTFARENKISLEEVNKQASFSYEKARKAQESGFFESEIVPIGEISQDDLPSLEKIARMRQKAESDISCAYNTSIPSDNGSATILCNASFLEKYKLKPMARVLGFSRIDRSARNFVDSSVQSIQDLLGALEEKKGYKSQQFEIMEINEAFGIQLPVYIKYFPDTKLNVNGGAIALGHPIGSAGARLLVTLLHAMRRLNLHYGVMAICFGGGGSYAFAVEVLS